MSLLGSSSAQVPTKYNEIHTNEAVYGTTIPILFGQNRLGWKLVWYGGFKANKAKQQGGSGLAKGGVQYVYTAALAGILAHGELTKMLTVWDSSGKFLVDRSTENYTVSASSPTFTPANASNFTVDHGVVYPQSLTTITNDFGAGGPQTVTNTSNIPMSATTNPTPPPGSYFVDGATGIYTFNPSDVGTQVSISYSFYRYQIVANENDVIPLSGPFHITVNNQPNFEHDKGVTFFPSGIALTPVSGSPSAHGTYNPNGGIYEFAAVDAGLEVTINYQYKDLNTDANAPNTLGFTFFNGANGQAVWPFLATNFPGQAIGYSGVSYVGSPALYLGYSPMIPQYSFECVGLHPFGGLSPTGGILTDASPSDCIQAVLTDPAFGVGYPEAYLQGGISTPNILGPTNGNFETGSAIPPTGWVTYGGSPALSYDTTTPYEGTQSLVITATVPNEGVRSSQLFTCNYGDNVSLQVAIRNVSGTMTPSAYVAFYDITNTIIGTSPLVTTTASGHWFFRSVQVNAPYGAVGYYVQTDCQGSSASTVWEVDVFQVTFTQVTTGLQTNIRAYWAANNFFISPSLDAQTSAAAAIGDWLDAGQVMTYCSEGVMKFTPIADTFAQANGYTFYPPTNPIVSLDDDDFMIGKNEDPIKITRSPWQNRWNDVRIGWSVRTNSYQVDVLEASDAGSIDQHGLMREDPKTWRFICLEDAAQFAANRRLQRLINVTNKYEFTIKETYAYLEPGDIVEITDGITGGLIGSLGLNQVPVRILKTTYPAMGGIKIEAENFPYSISQVVLYPKQGQLPSAVLDVAQADPGNTNLIAFEEPDRHAKYTGNKLLVCGNGVNNNWGGYVLYVSFDGVNYNPMANIDTPARQGILSAPLSAYPGTNPDTGEALSVNMTQSGAVLQSVTSTAAAQGVTQCAIINAFGRVEFVSYGTATLTGTNTYDLTTLYRGLFNTDPTSHVAGEQFVRLTENDGSIYEFQYDSSYYGQTIYLKACSYNLYGNQQQSIDDVTAYPITLQGVGQGSIDLDTGNLNTAQPAYTAYRPLSNPLTAHDAGASATINIGSFTMRLVGFEDIVDFSGAISGLLYNTLYFVYYDDPQVEGGAVGYQITTIKETALEGISRFYVGSIVTPAQGAPDTTGNNDGGSGAQSGMLNTLSMSVYSSVIVGSATATNLNNMVDGTKTDFGTLSASYNAGTDQSATVILSAPPGIARRFSTTTLKVLRGVPTNTGTFSGSSTGGTFVPVQSATAFYGAYQVQSATAINNQTNADRHNTFANFSAISGFHNTICVSCILFNYSGSSNPHVISDNLGHTYNLVRSEVNGQNLLLHYNAVVTNTSAPITITLNSVGTISGNNNNFMAIVASEMFGLLSPVVVDTSNGNQPSAFTGAITTSFDYDLVFSCICNNAAANVTPTSPSGFTFGDSAHVIQPNGLNGADPVLAHAYIPTNLHGTTLNPFWTGNTAFGGTGITVAYRANAPTVSLPSTTAGNSILVNIYGAGTIGTVTVTDSNSTAYSQIAVQTDAAPGAPYSPSFCTAFLASNIPGGTITIRPNFTGTQKNVIIHCTEASGLITASPVDVSNTKFSTSTHDTGSVTTLHASDVVLSFLGYQSSTGSVGATVPAGFTSMNAANSAYASAGSVATGAYVSYQTQSATGTFDPTWSGVSSGHYSGITYALRMTFVPGSLPSYSLAYSITGTVGTFIPVESIYPTTTDAEAIVVIPLPNTINVSQVAVQIKVEIDTTYNAGSTVSTNIYEAWIEAIE